ncbi:MAG TPA: MFS transporter [Anaerolineaceae bacterium]
MQAQYTRRNALLNIIGETLWGLKANLVVPSVVLAVLLYQYGASPELIGAISAIETSMLLLPQMLGSYIFHSRQKRKVQLVLWHYLAMLPFNIVMGVVTFFANQMDAAVYRLIMLACFAGFTAAIGVIAASWFDYFLGTIYDSSIRGTVMGLSTFGASISGTAGTLLAGWMIKTLPSPQSYAWLYLISWALGMLSISVFLFIKDVGGGEHVESERPSVKGLLASLRSSLAVLNFRRYLVGRALAVTGFSIVPFIAIYYTSAGLAKDFVVSCFAAFTVANALGSLVVGRLGDRFGHRWGIIFGAVMQIVALGMAIAMPTAAGVILTYAAAGLTSSSGFVAHYNLVLEMYPGGGDAGENPGGRVAHISIANLIIGIPASLAPLAAGVIAREASLPALFYTCIAISALAVLWYLLRFRDPRR